jgi:hypothetical protein
MIVATHGILANATIPSTLNNSLYAVYNAENNTNDSFGSRNGTAMGGLTYTTGKIGNAFNLNGTTSYVDFGDNFDIGTSSWSFDCWLFTTSTASNQNIFSKTIAAGLTGRYLASLVNGVDVRFFFAAVDSSNLIDIRLINTNVLNQWNHYVFMFDRSDKMKIYRNGVLTSPTLVSGTNNLIPYASTNYNTDKIFIIGAGTSSNTDVASNFFNGQIDNFNIWNRILNQDEITELYNSGNGKQYPY